MDRDFYSLTEAAKILKLTTGRVRQMLRSGDLEGIPPEESGDRGWRIPMRAVHDQERPGRVERPPEPPESPERLSELEIEDAGELRYQLGLSRGRLELTERAESTLREMVDAERRRAEQAEAERTEAQREIDALRSDLAAARQEAARPWWRKLFGN